MSLLKKENWVVCALLCLLSRGLFFLVLAYFMKLYKKEAWYCDYRYWLVGALCCFFPLLFLVLVFIVQMIVFVAKSLHVPGEEIYAIPYSWILCLVIPVVGWALLIIMFVYIVVWSIVMLQKGEGEHFLEKM